MTKEPTITQMTKTRAKEILKRVNEYMTDAGALLIELRDQEGWRALGYSSFKECCEKELKEQFGSRGHIYQLMNQAEVSDNVGRAVPLAHAQALTQLPPEEQKGALKDAVAIAKEAGAEKVTTEHVQAAVEARIEEPAKTPAAKSIAAAKTTPAKVNPKLEPALVRIGEVCGKPVLKAIREGILKQVTERECIYWAGLKDEEMEDIQELVVAKRWAPTEAYKFRARMVGPKTTVEELQAHCIAEGGSWEGTVAGFRVVVTQEGRRK